MLWKATALKGRVIAASDGKLGTVSDLLFDDVSWQLRWLVVDTGHWLPGHKVLLPMSVLGHLELMQKEFPVRLTMQQVKDSPGIDTERPVSRQMETSIYDYYGWTPYWGNGLFTNGYGIVGGYGVRVAGGTLSSPGGADAGHEREIADAQRDRDDHHLRSVNAVIDYRIRARDGEIGHVEDFLVEDGDWTIHYLIVDTQNWWPGKRVLVSPRSASEINWSEKLVKLNVDRKKIKDSPPYDPSTTVDRAYEMQFRDHYGDALPEPRPAPAVAP